jgi:hypothetical protein
MGDAAMYFLLIAVALISLITSDARAQQVETPRTAQAPDDLWLTVRVLPNVKLKTLRLIADITEPERQTPKKGESISQLLRQQYGNASQKIRAIFKSTNLSVTSDIAEGDEEILLPGGPRWYFNTKKVIPLGSTLWEQASIEVGSAGPKTLRDIQAANPGLQGRVKRLTDRPITLPYATRFASYRLRDISTDQMPLILDRLKADPAVLHAELGRVALVPHWELAQVRAMSEDCATVPTEEKWPLQISSPQEVLQRLTGNASSVAVAILDSGIAQNDGRFVFWQNPEPNSERGNYHDEDRCLDDTIGCNTLTQQGFPLDDLEQPDLRNHGTHVAGLASGRFLAEPLLSELNRRIKLMILKVARSDGMVMPGDINNAITYAVNKRAAIVNMSFEGSYSPTTASQMRGSKTVLFVVAAGNGRNKKGIDLDNKQESVFPAELSREQENVIAVAAHDARGRLACFSNYGAHTVDIAAPGIEIESTVVDGTLKLSGTSQAAPLVTLVAALLYSQGVGTPSAIKHRILSSVDFLPELKNKVTSGGKLNLTKAISVCDDLVELSDHSLLRGKIIEPEYLDVFGESERLPFRSVKKLVISASISPNYRITVLKLGKLQHIYTNLNLPSVVMQIGDERREISVADIIDIIPAQFPPGPVLGQCANK